MHIEPETIAFVEGGKALIVGLLTPDGEPFACRGWAMTKLPDGDERCRFRLLLDANDLVQLGTDLSGGVIAVTATDVPTLRSRQLKGRVLGMEPVTPADRVRFDEYTEAFMSDVVRTDGSPREGMQRIFPLDIAAVTIEIDELFDQTPGPGAGACLRGPGA